MWGKVLIWVLLLPYHLTGLCDVGVLRSLAICHLQFLVFAVLSRHVPALNVFPCGVPRLQKQTIWGPEVPKNGKLLLHLIFMTIYCCIWFIQIQNRCFHYLHDFLHFSEIYENQLTCLSSTNWRKTIDISAFILTKIHNPFIRNFVFSITVFC